MYTESVEKPGGFETIEEDTHMTGLYGHLLGATSYREERDHSLGIGECNEPVDGEA